MNAPTEKQRATIEKIGRDVPSTRAEAQAIIARHFRPRSRRGRRGSGPAPSPRTEQKAATEKFWSDRLRDLEGKGHDDDL